MMSQELCISRGISHESVDKNIRTNLEICFSSKALPCQSLTSKELCISKSDLTD